MRSCMPAPMLFESAPSYADTRSSPRCGPRYTTLMTPANAVAATPSASTASPTHERSAARSGLPGRPRLRRQTLARREQQRPQPRPLRLARGPDHHHRTARQLPDLGPAGQRRPARRLRQPTICSNCTATNFTTCWLLGALTPAPLRTVNDVFRISLRCPKSRRSTGTVNTSLPLTCSTAICIHVAVQGDLPTATSIHIADRAR